MELDKHQVLAWNDLWILATANAFFIFSLLKELEVAHNLHLLNFEAGSMYGNRV